MAPRRPVVFEDQIPLLIVTLMALLGGLALLAWLADLI